jgi:hypothetical protein
VGVDPQHLRTGICVLSVLCLFQVIVFGVVWVVSLGLH